MSYSLPRDSFELSPEAIAHHKMIFNATGVPVDYEFLNVNRSYAAIMKTDREKIIGKKLSELIPSLHKNDPDWFIRYGELAVRGGTVTFEQFFQSTNAWHRIVAFSEGDGEFISFSSDITAEKMVVQVSETLLQSTVKGSDIASITEQVRKLSGAKYAAFNRMAEDGHSYITQAIAGDDRQIAQGGKFLGIGLIGHKWAYDQRRADLMKGATIQRFATLNELAGSVLPQPLMQKMEKVFHLGSVYVVKILKEETLIGDFTLMMETGKELDNKNLVEIFIRLMGLSMERNRLETASDQQTMLLDGLLDAIPDRIFFKDVNRVYRGCNKSCEKVVGRSREDIIGLKDEDLFESTVAVKYRNSDHLTIKKLQAIHSEQIEVDAENHRHWFDTLKAPLFQKNGELMGLVGISREITHIREAEEELRESEERFRELVELAPDPISVHVNEKVVYVNRAILKMVGADSVDDVIGRNIYELIHPAFLQRLKKWNSELLESKVTGAKEFILVRLDGTPVNVEAAGAPIRYHGKQGALIYFRDITERKNEEKKKLEQMTLQRQQQKREAIGTLAGGVAHDINNPITGIINYAQLILDREPSGSENSGYAAAIIEEGARVAGITHDLLEFSRQEGKTYQQVNCGDLIIHTVSLMKSILEQDGINLKVNFPSELPLIRCHPRQIKQVIMNLMNNARDALNEKYDGYHADKTIRIHGRLLTDKGRPFVRMTVEDHGSGIPEAIQESVFDPFFSTKPKETAVGMGLSVSYGIVEEHHGKLSIETAGSLTRFHMDLPVDAEQH